MDPDTVEAAGTIDEDLEDLDGTRAGRRRRRRVVLVVAALAGGAILGVALLGTPRATEWLLTAGVRAATGVEGARVQVGTVRGSRLRSLTLTDLRVALDTVGSLLTADTLRLRYRLFPLLGRRVELGGAGLVGAALDLRSCVVAPLRARGDAADPADAPVPDEGSTPWSVHVASVSVVDARATGGGCDAESAWSLDRLNARLDDVRAGDTTGAAIHEVSMSIRPAGLPDGYEAALRFSGRLAGGALTVDTLTLVGPDSDVAGRGTLRPLTASAGAPDIDFTLRADPVALRDVQPFVDVFAPGASARVDVRIVGDAAGLDVDGTVAVAEGGEATLEAEVVAAEGAPLRYRGLALLDGLDPAALLAAGPEGAIDGRVEWVLEGTSTATLSGTTTVAVTRPGGEEPLALDGRATWTEGQADLDATLRTRSARVTVAGRATPFAPTRDLDVAGDFAWEAPDTAGGATSLAGTIVVAGSFAQGAPSGHVEVALGRSVVRGAAIDTGSLVVELDGGDGAWRADASMGDGSIDASGRLTLADGATVRIDSARVASFDLAPLGATPWPTRLNGRVEGTGRVGGGVAGPGDWSGRLTLVETSLGPLVLDTAGVSVALEAGTFRVDWLARSLSGSLDGVVEGELADTGIRAVARGSFQGLDLAVLEGSPTGPTALSGGYDADVATDAARRSQARGSVSLTRSRVRALTVDTARVEVDMRGDSLDVSTDLRSSGGAMRWTLGRAPGATGPVWTLPDARFTDIDLAALSDSAGMATRLTGALTAALAGTSPGTLDGEIGLRLDPSTVGASSLDSLTLTSTVEDGRSRWVGSLHGDDVAGVLSGAVTASDDPVGVDGSVRFDGVVRGVRVDSSRVAFRAAGGALTADTVLVWSPLLTASGRAASRPDSLAARRSDASLVVDLTGSAPLASWIGLRLDDLVTGRAVLAGTAVGDSVGGRVRVDATGLVSGSIRVDRLEADVVASWHPDRGLFGVEGGGEAQGITVGRTAVERIGIGATSDGDRVAITVDARLDPTRSVSSESWVTVAAGGTTGTLRSLDLALAGQEWRLDGPAEVALVDGLDVRDFSLSSPSGRIAANGYVRPGDAQAMVVTVEGLQLAGFSDLLGYQGLEGTLDGSFDLTGTAVAPVLLASTRVEATLPGVAPATLVAETRYAERALDVEATLDPSGTSGRVRVVGRLPYTVTLAAPEPMPDDRSETRRATLVRGGPVALELLVDGFGLAWLSPWLPPEVARDLVGALDADVTVNGTTDALALDGSIDLVGAGGYLPGAGLRLGEGTFVGRLDGDRLVVEQASVRSGNGRLAAAGTVRAVDLTTGELDLHLTLDDFQAVNTQVVRAVLGAELDVSGTTAAPRVTGDLEVLRGDVFLGDELGGARAEPVELTEEDYEALSRRFGYEPPADSVNARPAGPGPLALDVQVHVGRDVWIRQQASPKLSVQLTGDVRVQKEPDELERVFGTLEAVPRGSFVEQFGRRFAITRGEVVFNGPPEELRLDVSSEYAVPAPGDPTANEVVIGLAVSGGVDDLALVLSSEPEMENADIVSYLATGRPASQTLQFDSEGNGLIERGASLALGQATDAVERLASESIGLDVVQIRTEGGRGVTIAAGRYVSPRLYVGFSQPVSFRRSESAGSTRSRSPEVEIEYQAFRWLLLNLRREGSRLDFFLRSRYAY